MALRFGMVYTYIAGVQGWKGLQVKENSVWSLQVGDVRA